MIPTKEHQGLAVQPLRGKHIVLVRDAHRAKDTIAHLSDTGASVSCFPSITLSPNPSISVTELCDRLAQSPTPALLLLTSPTAAATFFASAPVLSPSIIIAAVGQRTAATLERLNHPARIIASEQTAEGLARAVIRYLGNAADMAYCLHPTSDRSLPTLCDRLRAAGLHCEEEILYLNRAITYTDADIHVLLAQNPDAFVFYSPTAVDAFLAHQFPPLALDIPFIAIGPVTAQAIVARGFKPAAVATQPSDSSLITALIRTLEVP